MYALTLDKQDVDDAVRCMCNAAQLPDDALTDPRYKYQVTAFILALRKNFEREQTYNGLWRQYGLDDCASNAKSKAVRLKHHGDVIDDAIVNGDGERSLADIKTDAEDDALDLINYGAFCARLIHEAGSSS